jgi:organic hydroperoxide reductase OsmC/OhrA
VRAVDSDDLPTDNAKCLQNCEFQRIGAPGFEPGTSCSQSKRATRLRHAPQEAEYTGVSIGLVGVGIDSRVHRYAARTAWSGSTAQGYDAYDRAHDASAAPADARLALSSDPAFNGDAARLNPEQLVLLAASSCQLLSFLAVAARARADVVAYEDDAEAVMPEDERPVRLTRITLRPRITVKGDAPSDERLHRLVQTAHRECYVANSLSTEIVVEPVFVRAAPPAA